MSGFLGDFKSIEKIFLVSAVLGGFLFIGRMVLMFIGGHHGSDDADGADGDLDHGGVDTFDAEHGDVSDHHGDVVDADQADSDISFKALSLQGLTAFFMMFGLVGLALSRQSKWSAGFALLGATVAGIICIWLIGKVFTGMIRLQSDGTMNIRDAIGQEGMVYLTIPATGKGVVQVSIQDSLREINAVSYDKSEIKTGERIIVEGIIGVNLLVVKKIQYT